MSQSNKNIKITVLYSSKEADQAYFQDLFSHLKLLERNHPNVEVWHRDEELLGQEVKTHLRRQLDQSDIVLLLLSSDYLIDELVDLQTQRLLENYSQKARRGTRYIMPIILRAFDWEDVYDSQYDLEALPVLKNPISSVENKDEVFSSIMKKLSEQIEIMMRRPMKIILPTWVGNIGAVGYNQGLKANKRTPLFKQLQRIIHIELNDSIHESCENWKAGKYDVIGTTLDCLPLVLKELEGFEPKIIYQTSWSKGADAIVGRGSVKSIADLKGKKVICVKDTPSYAFLQFVLQSAGMTLADVDLQFQHVNHPDEAIKYFLKTPQVEAIVLWSPYLEVCLREAKDTTVIADSSAFPGLITDVLISSENYIQLNEEELTAFIEGWLDETNAAEADRLHLGKSIQILSDSILESLPQIVPRTYLREISELLVTYFNMSAEGIHLCNLKDNLHFFDIVAKTDGEPSPSIKDLIASYAILPGFENIDMMACLEPRFVKAIYERGVGEVS